MNRQSGLEQLFTPELEYEYETKSSAEAELEHLLRQIDGRVGSLTEGEFDVGVTSPAKPSTLTPAFTADSNITGSVVPANLNCGVYKVKGKLFARSPAKITHVVIHSLIGTYASALKSWHTSTMGQGCYKPHYVIRNDGRIAQVVPEKYIPYHADNANGYSIGIEHDGKTDDPSWFTENMYTASAALTRDICLRYSIPMNGTRIIGHDEAPGTGHGDPGGYWDWDYYLAMVNWNWNSATKPVRIVVDSSMPGFRASQNWKSAARLPIKWSPHPKHSYGKACKRATPAPGAADDAVFEAMVPVAGDFEIAAWWPVDRYNNPETHFSVNVSGAMAPSFSARVNQQVLKGKTRKTLALPATPQWFTLGTVSLQAGDRVHVNVSRNSLKPGWVVADAIRLLKT